MIGLCLRASFLTNVVLFYNDHFTMCLKKKTLFIIWEKNKFVIVLGFYRVVKTVVSFKVVLTKTLCIIYYTGWKHCALLTEAAYGVKYFKPIPNEINQDTSTVQMQNFFFHFKIFIHLLLQKVLRSVADLPFFIQKKRRTRKVYLVLFYAI